MIFDEDNVLNVIFVNCFDFALSMLTLQANSIKSIEREIKQRSCKTLAIRQNQEAFSSSSRGFYTNT